MKINRSVLVQALKVAQSTKTEFTMTRGLSSLVERGLGSQAGQSYRIDRLGRKALRDWLRSEGVEWTMPISALNDDRLGVARQVTNEKVAQTTAGAKRVMLAALGHGAHLNGQPLPVIDGAFVSMDIASIRDVYTRHLLIVENKSAFEAVGQVQGDFDRKTVLAVYRSDPQNPYGQQWAMDASKRYGLPLAAYMDFDPTGISLGLSSGARRLLLPDLDALEALKGSDHDFRNQHIDWHRLTDLIDEHHPLAPWVAFLGRRKAGFTQERLIAHQVAHQWLDLPVNEAQNDG